MSETILNGYEKSYDKFNLRQLKCEIFFSYLFFEWSVFHFNLMVLIIYLILPGSLPEYPEIFTLGTKLKLTNETDMLNMIVKVLIHVDGKPYYI